MSSNSITAIVNGDGTVVIKRGDRKRIISVNDYLTVMSKIFVTDNKVGVGVGFRYPSSIHSCSRREDGYMVNLYYPEQPAILTHDGDQYKVMMPNVMIRVHLKEVDNAPDKFSIGYVRWFATDMNKTELGVDWPTEGSNQDHIWTLPLPNMYHNATMCMGDNRLPSIIYSDWTILDMLYTDILCRSEFNNDLSMNSLNEDMSPTSWLNVLDADPTKFPYDQLVNY